MELIYFQAQDSFSISTEFVFKNTFIWMKVNDEGDKLPESAIKSSYFCHDV